MLSTVIIGIGILKVFKDYKRGFIKKLKGIISIVISIFLYPLIIPIISEIVYKTDIATYLNEFNLLLIKVLSTDLGGNLIQENAITALMSSTIVSITKSEIKVISIVLTMFATNIIFTAIFSFTDLLNRFVLTAQLNRILGAATGIIEYSFYVCIGLAFIYLVCIYVESPVIMRVLEGDQFMNYVYVNNPIINLLLD